MCCGRNRARVCRSWPGGRTHFKTQNSIYCAQQSCRTRPSLVLPCQAHPVETIKTIQAGNVLQVYLASAVFGLPIHCSRTDVRQAGRAAPSQRGQNVRTATWRRLGRSVEHTKLRKKTESKGFSFGVSQFPARNDKVRRVCERLFKGDKESGFYFICVNISTCKKRTARKRQHESWPVLFISARSEGYVWVDAFIGSMVEAVNFSLNVFPGNESGTVKSSEVVRTSDQVYSVKRIRVTLR